MRYLAVPALLAAAAVAGDLEGMFRAGNDHPAIQYPSRPTRDPAALLNRSLREGKVKLRFDQKFGYLPSLLDALDIPVESQMLVFSKTSVQAQIIHTRNPRALYFNDTVAVGYVKDSGMLEIASQDPELGAIFYVMHQAPVDTPVLDRRNSCIGCHEAPSSLGVPGWLMRSVHPAADGLPVRPMGEYRTDHRSPMEQRWGGWYVTGTAGSAAHMGNMLALNAGKTRAHLSAEVASEHLTPHSDIVALTVFGHQVHMTNLLTRAAWEARLGPGDSALRELAREVVDYLLYIDEPPLEGKLEGTSGFTAKFASAGPLREFDLTRRTMRYPCSYMIYSAAFDALPAALKSAIYDRLWLVLSGEEKGPKYARLSQQDRSAVVKILRKTKSGLPETFGGEVN